MAQFTRVWRRSDRAGRAAMTQLSPHLLALGAYAVVAVGFSWPLALHMHTHLLGDPAGDTGVYFWNQWVFRHELQAGHLPYFTDRIFATTAPRANLSLHNYTPFQNLLAVPLQPWLGAVASFNAVFLLMRVVTAYATYLLAVTVSRARWESWLAGLLFAWSPLLVTRGMGHLSLLAAAPLCVFLLLALRWSVPRHRWVAVGLGACIAWAVYSDVYYGVYCLAAGAIMLIRPVLSFPRRAEVLSLARRAVDVGLVLLACLCVIIAISGGTSVSLGGIAVHLRTLYNPMLALAVLLVVRVLLRRRIDVLRPDAAALTAAVRSVALAGATATALLAPLLFAVGVRVTQGRFDPSPTYWRSSPAGVDLLALVSPNPNHPFVPGMLRTWLEPASDRYLEHVVSLSLVGLLVIGVAAWRGWRPPTEWTWLAAVFAALALGPFVHIAGVNTTFPGPWALLRYVPLLGLARTPARFSVMLTLVFGVLVAAALAWLARRLATQRRPLLLATVTVAVVLELLPAPRVLHSASVPDFYRRVAEAPNDVRVLHVPFGLRDGTSSVGNFSARTQFFQTAHGKPLVGGYLSRVSGRRAASVRSEEVLSLLLVLSEGRALDAALLRRLEERAPEFVQRARIGFVVLDRQQISHETAEVLQRAMRLTRLDTDGQFELYEPSPRGK